MYDSNMNADMPWFKQFRKINLLFVISRYIENYTSERVMVIFLNTTPVLLIGQQTISEQILRVP